MNKLSFKLNREQLEGLSELTTQYLQEITWKDVRGNWMRHTLYALVQRLDKAAMKCTIERKGYAKLTCKVDEYFAFVLLYDKHPVDPTNYLDNTILQMLNSIKQYYA
jgi:hypothetical protein